MSILKVFASKDQVPAILETARLIEKYDAFVVVEASDSEAKALAKRFPVEDISAQYRVQLGDRSIDTLGRRKPSGPSKATKARGAAKSTKAAKAAAAPKPLDVWAASPLEPGPHHYVVQFVGPIKRAWLTRVRATGAEPREPHGGFGYVVRATDAQLRKIAVLDAVLWIGHLPHQARLAPGLATKPVEERTLPRRRSWPGAYRVELFDVDDAQRIARAARALGFKVLASAPKAPVLSVSSDAATTERRKQLKALAAVHGVRFIRELVVPRSANNVATQLMGNAFTAIAANGLNLTGEGEIVAVCDTGIDTGDAATIHADFAGRVVAIKSYAITTDWSSIIFNPSANDGAADLDSGHGTHVAGSVLGDGTASNGDSAVIRGHAHKAQLVFQAVEQEMEWRPEAPEELSNERYLLSGIPSNLTPLFQFAYNQGARIHSNSWGGGDPGAYDEQCRQFDAFVWSHPDLCFVIAAGNDGTDMDGDGEINLTSVTSPGTAKNCITVGASENQRPEFNAERYGDWWPDDYPVAPFNNAPMADSPAQVVAFSSRGPTSDGRVKPDVVAPGTFVLSTRSSQIASNNFAWAAYPPNHQYFHMGGTSMATPLVAGACALVREYARTRLGIDAPTAALLKAMLVAGAERLPATAPSGTLVDNHQGFGRVNLDRSLKGLLGVAEHPGIDTGETVAFALDVAQSGKTLRLALAYSDYPGDTLVNNLNLVASDPTGKGFAGNQPDSSAGLLAFDTLNNVEIVQVKNAKKGRWTIRVIGSNVSVGPQPFALCAVLV